MKGLIPVIPPRCTWTHGRTPNWKKAWRDPGLGSGCYLKLPYGGGDMDKDECTTRVRCHLSGKYELVKVGAGWYWKKLEERG